ncbi:hypothetical protein [uncultured Tenacibaculum sp.]|uniref:hypothetical protein n=1 Tax=uncultured Tenacibaculum sp. TaxID=174713 RepID=UPI002613E4E4|nr:hypothetical protein [uncultured Tenacibaculum sp.]
MFLILNCKNNKQIIEDEKNWKYCGGMHLKDVITFEKRYGWTYNNDTIFFKKKPYATYYLKLKLDGSYYLILKSFSKKDSSIFCNK